ncbi:hypothetical protein L596_007544 [Steinernema carpocapsae]|uniref:Uncharacterized protein n=1 Tax=Steinernema carpocapsae TaxID=34508 RepID=A0A4U5P9N3_STECR|nr:hypothetical protein L596_007544 [Steinernema carpocapsae]
MIPTIFLLVFLLSNVSDSFVTGGKVLNVQALWRHGDRSPVGTYPTDPHQESSWTVSWGELTTKGMEQHYKQGLKLKREYIDNLNFISPNYTSKQILIRSTDSKRTLASAYSNLAGFFSDSEGTSPSEKKWPMNWTPVPVHTVSQKDDLLLSPFAHCPRRVYLHNMRFSKKDFQELLDRNKDLFDLIRKHAEIEISDFFRLVSFANGLYIEKLYNLPLPSWITEDVYNRSLSLSNEAFGFIVGLRPQLRHQGRCKQDQCTGHQSQRHVFGIDLGLDTADASNITFIWFVTGSQAELPCGATQLLSTKHGGIEETRVYCNISVIPPCRSCNFLPVANFVKRIENIMFSVNNRGRTTLLGLSTAWDWLKELTNGALGQPMEQLKSAAVDQRFDFTLHEMRNVTFEDSLQKMLRRREYDAAIDLSTEFGEEVDIVYKQKWIDRPQDYSKEFVMESLSQISDYSFVFTECCSNTNRSPEIQEIVLELLQSLCDHVDHHDRFIIYHYKRVWDIFMANEAPKVDCYLHFRRKSLLLIACSIAEEFDKDILRSLIPESINPKLYESFLPRNASDLFEDIRRNSGQQKKYPYLDEHRDSASVKQLNFDLSETGFELAHRNAEDWFRERVFAIDQDSGNVDIMSKLLELAIERGFTQMREMHTEVEFYRDMVLFCGTNMSLESFSVTTSKKVVALLGKHLTEDDVCANIDRLISLFEHLKKSGRSEDVAADVVDLIALFSEKSLKLLGAVKERHRKYVSEEALVRCFCLFEATGDPLIAASKRLGIASNFISALEVFNAHGFHPRYEPVHKSLESDVSVEQILIQFFSSAKPETSADWIRLRDNAFKVRDLIYSEVMEKNTVLRLLAFKMLLIEDDSEVYNLQKCPTDVVLSFDPERKAQEKLSAAESIAVLIDLSRDYWNNAQPDINDPNLKKARQVLEIVPDKFKTVSMREYIRQLDVVECALRLGCTKLPVNIRFTEPEDLISECVQIGTNYKKVLKCAELALLLGFHNPKATAMELCAEQALKAKDEKVLTTYVERLASSAKGLSNICGVCIEILQSPYLKNMRNELMSCALLNCPLNEINSTLQLIGEMENEDPSKCLRLSRTRITRKNLSRF